MSKRLKLSLAAAVIAIVIVLLWISWIHHQHPPGPGTIAPPAQQTQQRPQAAVARSVSPTSQPGATGPRGPQPLAATKKPIPKPVAQPSAPASSTSAAATAAGKQTPGAGTAVTAKAPARLPQPPPLPQVPAKANEAQRKELFALKKSVDHIVTANEPFSVNDEQWTIDKIKKRLAATRSPKTPAAEAREPASSYVKKPIEKRSTPVYYGVRLVRPGENIWNIHYNILREYFVRRHVRLPANADEPLAGGKSTGIGRLLKFLEGVVYVYDVQQNRLVKNLNLIRPHSIIVFFKISEVFSALDRLSVKDLRLVHYISRHLVVEDPVHPRELLDQDALRQ